MTSTPDEAAPMLNDPKVRAIAIQAFGVAAFVGLLVAGAATAWQRLREQGVAYGFGILFRPTGWTINSPFLTQAASDPYWWTIAVALVNTAVVGLLGIVLSTIVGFAIGVGRLSGNAVIAWICTLYLEIFRNVPLVLQVVFWYVSFISLPTPRAHPPTLFNLAYLTNKGVYLPGIEARPGSGPVLWLIGLAVLILVIARPMARRLGRGIRARSIGFAAGAAAVLLACEIAIAGSPVTIEIPTLTGFSFHGGAVVPLEIIALTYAIVIFSSAYVSEIVRGGLLSVPKGQIEAALSVGLPAWIILFKVRLPIALRSMIPPLGNQYIFIIKATALEIAVGYSDLFAVSVVSISQTGQAIEFLAVMMAAYVLLNYSMTQVMGSVNRAVAFKGRAE